MKDELITTKSEAIAGNNAGLDDSILLPCKRLGEKSKLWQELSPCLNEEKPQQPSSNVQRRNNPNRQIELVGDDTEESPEKRTHH